MNVYLIKILIFFISNYNKAKKKKKKMNHNCQTLIVIKIWWHKIRRQPFDRDY